jgi:hypothetical protein
MKVRQYLRRRRFPHLYLFCFLVASILLFICDSRLLPTSARIGSALYKSKSIDRQQAPVSSYKKTNTSYFLTCSLAGAISCSFTHCITLPLDVLKTKIQASAEYSSLSSLSAMKIILAKEGLQTLFRGTTCDCILTSILEWLSLILIHLLFRFYSNMPRVFSSGRGKVWIL